ncbi:MAG: sigma-70 family RNA polymerase sigma factor [Deltaproteobacteria bacterium]
METRLDRVLAEMGWVRRLAGVLARDEIAAEDVAQEAWLVAAQHAPDDERPLRPWLARVVHNLVRMRHRGATRRATRERDSTPPSAQPTPHDLLERVEAQRAIAEEVVRLAEPYREVVLLHYVEGVSTHAIARRLDVPPGTVRRRLSVARDRLRERLRRGDRIALVLLLAVARSRTARATPLALGALTMKKTLAAIALIALLLLLGAELAHRRHGRSVAPRVTGTTVHRALVPAAMPASTAASARVFAPRHIAGRVVLAGGQPVAHAVVRLGSVPFPNAVGDLEPLAVVQTDAHGNFDFGIRSVGDAIVVAEAPEHAVAWVRVDAAPVADRIVLELGGCSTRVVGIVRDAAGTAIPKARITTLGLGGFDAAADGSFVACMSPGWVDVRAEGYGGVMFDVSVAGRVHHDVTLVPEGVLVGSVTDEAGRAVGGAHVGAFVDAGEHGCDERSGTSDAEGRFRIAGFTPARYRLVAIAPGMGTRTEVHVTVKSGTATPEVHLVLVTRARVTGRVTEHGAAAVGARVSIVDRDDGAYAVSGTDGQFVLDGVPLGTLELAAAPYHVDSPRRVVVDRLELTGVTLEVSRVGLLHGRVVRAGAAVTGADVSCGDAHSSSDATGAYAFSDLADDHCKLVARSGDQATAPLDVAISSEPQVIDLDLAASSTIRGLIVDARGAPVTDAFLVVRAPAHPSDLCTSATDDAGAFACSGLSGGDYELAAYPAPGTRPFHATTNPSIHVDRGGDAKVTVTVDSELLTIHGTVVDDTGAPIADALVEARTSSTATTSITIEPMPTVRTDAAGTFTIERLAAGTYTLSAHAGEGGDTLRAGIAAGATGVELQIARAGSIAGDLVGFTTPPEVTIHRITYGGGVAATATVDGATFTATGLEPGTYRLEAYDYAASLEADATTVVVESGRSAHATLASRARGSVEATVLDATTRAPVPGLYCHVAAVSDGQIGCCGWLFGTPGVMSDPGGHLRLESPAGAVRVFCMQSPEPPFSPDAPYSWASGDAIVPAGGTATTEVLAAPRIYPRSDIGFYAQNFGSPPAIISIDPAGPAAHSGLVVGDVIIALDGAPVATMAPSAVMTLATNHRPGTLLSVGTPRGTFTIVVAANAL